MKPSYRYETNCCSSTAELIHAMVDAAKPISYATFRRHVSRLELSESGLAGIYEWGRGKGLKLKDDFAVAYFKSTYAGRPCVFVKHSAIEYIFTP